MNVPSDWLRLDAAESVTVGELSLMCGMSTSELMELAEGGVLPLLGAREAGLRVTADWVGVLRQAARLRRDLELDLFTTGLLLGYLRRIEALERELASAHAQSPGRAAQPEPPRRPS